MKPRWRPRWRLGRRAAGAGGRVRRLPEPAPGGGPGQPACGPASERTSTAAAFGLGAALGRHSCAPAARCSTWPAAAAATCAGWRRRALRVTGVDRDADAVAPLRGRGRDRGRRHRRRRPGRCRAGASTPSSSPTTCGGRCWPALRAALAAGRRADLRDLRRRPAARSASRRGPNSCCSPGNCCRLCAGLRVVAFEDGFDAAPARYVQRIAAVAEAAGRRRAAALRRLHGARRLKSADWLWTRHP